jgi:hypothetical protein
MPLAPTCTGLKDCVVGLAQTLVFNDFKTLFYSDAPWYSRGLAFVGVVGDVVWVAKLAKAGTVAVGLGRAGEAADFAKPAGEGADLKTALEDAFSAPEGCGCFPGDTGVATPHGLVAIDRLHIGDRVLAEDPATHRVEPERVQAVIDDGIKPLMTVSLSDGSSLKVTTNHPFYVDSGPGITGPQWVQAGDLKVGDRLRTEDGQDVTVTALRYHTGYAHVYTLTVATDHDFFVGSAGVLVHNYNVCVLAARPKDSDWNIPNSRLRGRTIEAKLLPPGNVITSRTYPVIDSFIPATGEVESIKTIDLTQPFYQRASDLRGKLNYYSRQLESFTGANYAGVDTTGELIKSKTIVFVFEPNAADSAQWAVINQFIAEFPAKYPKIALRFHYMS